MATLRDKAVSFMLEGRLSTRRALRRWRQRPRHVLYDDGTGTAEEFGSKGKAGAAVLPAKLRDRAPIPEALLCALLFFVALLVRGWNISFPASVVFDEVHFLRFTKGYYYGKYLFDIHPPLGKLILLAVTRLFCGPPTMDFASNGEEFGEQRYTPLRWTSALFGSAVSPIMYLICRELGLSFPASVVPAVMQVFDHIVVVESRLVLVDAQLLFFKSLCLLLALRLWGARKGTRRRFVLLVGTALAGAAAISVKWTALATPGLVAIVSLLGRPFPLQGRLEVSEMAVAGSVAISFYAAVFWVHFRLLPNSGDGDAFMRRRFQRTLIGGSHYDPKVRAPSFAANFIWLNGEMFRANARIKTRHPWESKWYQWIIDQRGLLYYKDPQTSGKLGQIYLIVNPVVAVATLTALIAFVVVVFGVYIPKHRMGTLTSYSKLHGFVTRGVFFAAGFVINILPYLGALCATALSICLRFTHHTAFSTNSCGSFHLYACLSCRDLALYICVSLHSCVILQSAGVGECHRCSSETSTAGSVCYAVHFAYNRVPHLGAMDIRDAHARGKSRVASALREALEVTNVGKREKAGSSVF